MHSSTLSVFAVCSLLAGAACPAAPPAEVGSTGGSTSEPGPTTVEDEPTSTGGAGGSTSTGVPGSTGTGTDSSGAAAGESTDGTSEGDAGTSEGDVTTGATHEHNFDGDPVICSEVLVFMPDFKYVQIAGSAAGRIGFSVADSVHIFDVGADCSVEALPPLSVEAGSIWISGDGSRLITIEKWQIDPNFVAIRQGSRFYALPQAEFLGQYAAGYPHEYILGHDLADDGSRYTRYSNNQSHDFIVIGGAPPATPEIDGSGINFGDVLPRMAPSGLHTAQTTYWNVVYIPWGDRTVVVRELGEVVAEFPGTPIGFLDDEHILIDRYSGEEFVGVEIVDLDGLVVQATSLPELATLERLGTGEILGRGAETAVYDPLSGDVRWTAPAKADVALAGEDHLLLRIEGEVRLVRWR